jgi:general secretion pathway protein I
LCQSNKADHKKSDTGFTMIESLVALTVTAIALSAIGALVAANVRGTSAIEHRLALVDTVRMLLAALPDRGQLVPGDTTGELAGNQWRIDVQPFAADFVDPVRPTPWIPQAVIVRVQSPTGEILRVDTVRLRSAQGS